MPTIKCLILVTLTLIFQASSAWALKVLIDPGHGGIDGGALYGPAQESQIVLKVSQELAQKLKNDPRFEVALTRTKDQSVSLSSRVRKAEQFQPDLFLSLHANATPDKKAKGLEIYFQNQLPLDEDNLFLAHEEIRDEAEPTENDTEKSISIAKSADVKSILDDLKRQGRQKLSLHFAETLQTAWKGHIRQAPFYVIAKTKSPSVLVELGFLSHPQESQKLLTSSYQKEMAEKIYRALVQYSLKIKNSGTSLSQID